MKQTEIGLIPDDWEVKNINKECTIKARIGWQGLKSNEYLDFGDYVLITGTDFDNGFINWKSCNYVSEWRFKQDKNIQIKQGDVLITKDGTIGKVAFLDAIPMKGTLNSGVFVIRPKSYEKIDTVFLSLIFKSIWFDSFLEQITSGSTIVHLYQKDFVTFNFPIPPTLTEQQRIAKALSDVDAFISTTEKLIQKKKNIKQGAMQNLLTGKKRLPGFGPQTKYPTYKQTELGLIPEDWEVKALNELINDISDGPFGSNLKTEHYTTEREVRIIQLSNVGEDGWDNENVKYTTFTHAKEIQRCIVPYGSIVIAKMMPAGRAILCPNKEKMYILGSDCVRISPNNLLDSLFFMYFSKTSFYLNQIKENTQGSTRARTSVSKLKRIEIALPSKEEQTAIANVLSSMDKEIETLNTKLEKYRNLKTAMMQQLLTGKIRL